MKRLILIAFIFTLVSCDLSQQSSSDKPALNNQPPAKPQKLSVAGLWRGVLDSPGGELPFGIEIQQKGGQLAAHILNGQERVDTSAVKFDGYNVVIEFEWFDARISAQLTDDAQHMNGQWSKTASGKDKTSQLPFSASRGYDYRFEQELNNNSYPVNATGSWEVVFADEDGESLAIAEFQQSNTRVTGTFLTPTGDYRFLDGSVNGQNLKLSAFDGAHAFLFAAKIDQDKLTDGHFWSRESYHATWTGRLSDDTSEYLPSAWEMNQVTTEDNSVSFAFEDVNGQVVRLTDERFNGKPVIVNLFGTWCPNCNDEAPVLAKFYDKYAEKGLEIVGLAFEFTEEPERDKRQIKAFQKRHNIHYPLLLAGSNDKADATKVLGFLDEVKSYPTSIFLDHHHKVVNIHTGFAGPGTGSHYDELVEELEQQILDLIAPLPQ